MPASRIVKKIMHTGFFHINIVYIHKVVTHTNADFDKITLKFGQIHFSKVDLSIII